ncbi:MAG: hypothetical protein P1U32_08890 [Legionellaceae bacterium]|nr:hypothetical protein [Legionellaceae bacterium]
MKRPIAILILSALLLPIAFSASEDEKKNTKTHSSATSLKNKQPEESDSEWLANLHGLPTREEVEKLSKQVDKVMAHDKDKRCNAINPRLRKMIFLHFVTYQHIINQRSAYLTEKNIYHWAHVFGMLLKESSGDTTNVTSMTGRSYSTYQSKSDLERWQKITNLSKNGKIPLNYQTNFGLTQLSVDRLFVALQLARTPVHLKGQVKGLNTAVAIRRLIWFYQDFAQGRLSQTHDRIHHHERGNPEYSARFTFGVSMALLLCGTHYMFYEGYHEKAGGAADLTDAMASIAYCKLGNDKDGYGKTEANQKCFAEWVTLCPTLNFDIAMITPLKYFATRDAAPVCEGTFKALLKKKPVAKAPPKKKQHTTKHTTQRTRITLGERAKRVLNEASKLLNHVFKGTATQGKNPQIQP